MKKDFKENTFEKQININSKIQIKKQIRIGIYFYCIFNGGRARITSILINYLYDIKLFKLYLFSVVDKDEDDYKIPKNIKRTIIKHNLVKILQKNKIDILIYELDDVKEIELLNNLTEIKVIFYHHSSNFDWIYSNYSQYKSIYQNFKKSKYFISIVPFENDYLFKKWGINSILMDNFMTFEYNSIIPSDLSSNIILMIGRGKAKKKRFHIGIQSMEYIIKENPKYELQIVSNKADVDNLVYLVNNLNLENSVKFIGFFRNPELFFKNASLSFFPSISEAFPMVVIETKIFGIPNILIGLDYLTICKGGTIIIYNDEPEIFANEALKILNNKKYIKSLGEKARKSMKKFSNEVLKDKWIKLIYSIYKGDDFYQNLRQQKLFLYETDYIKIAINQIKLFKLRDSAFKNLTINSYGNFSIMEKLK